MSLLVILLGIYAAIGISFALITVKQEPDEGYSIIYKILYVAILWPIVMLFVLVILPRMFG